LSCEIRQISSGSKSELKPCKKNVLPEPLPPVMPIVKGLFILLNDYKGKTIPAIELVLLSKIPSKFRQLVIALKCLSMSKQQ
jgi:hypothetical protein